MNTPGSFQDFLKTQQNEHPSELWPLALKALWYDAKGDWKASHNIAQDLPSDLGSWIHAYLHRKEGINSTLIIGTEEQISTIQILHYGKNSEFW